MAKREQNVGVLTPKKYKHDLSHHHTTTLDWFRLQPIDCIECVEGDKMSINLSTILDAAPLATKVFGGANLDVHAFFVPTRILWDEFNEYRYGEKREFGTAIIPPFMTMNQLNSLVGGATLTASDGRYVYNAPNESIAKKNLRRVMSGLGYPCSFIKNGVSSDPNITFDSSYADMPISTLPMRAYIRCWWDWYRDSVNIPENQTYNYIYKNSGEAGVYERLTGMKAFFRCWRKDYITTLLESPQIGVGATFGGNVKPVSISSDTVLGDWGALSINVNSGYANADGKIAVNSNSTSVTNRPIVSLESSIQVNALRGAIAMQRFLEKLNVTGTRPIERIQALFGQTPSPVRLDMSELIGSHRQRVYINGLTNTGSSSLIGSVDETPLGFQENNAFGQNPYNVNFGQSIGRCYSEGNTPSFNYTATEDGFIVIIASLIPEYTNPTAVNRMFLRGLSTPDASNLDYYTPEFDGIGYQECLYNEISFPEYTVSNEGKWGVNYDPFKVAGYQPKYEEYRYIQDRISGDFNEPESSTVLRNYVFSKNLTDGQPSGALPTGVQLTTPDSDDVAQFDNHFQKTDSNLDHFIFDVHVNVSAVRPISKTELPTELSNLANSVLTDVSNGGIRL